MFEITWTDYMLYRSNLRGFNLEQLEDIIRYSSERYYDTATGRQVVVGKYNNTVVIIPYEMENDSIIPITVHATSRQQIKFRINNGRFIINE
ncbi:hypothetical protein PN462_14480 [Spirulina sp. CS-785/01]|uniref:hypothetical protein n=1 Tax=Spirulina sp. CS-785/01 TaxID=3021716 RepID=UPI00232A8CC7|nr:hypothetical protein [Spirulina sp. CS-785/01]MDB9314317.1 hypothetical protein [Spirulina sp. CS-785/01]